MNGQGLAHFRIYEKLTLAEIFLIKNSALGKFFNPNKFLPVQFVTCLKKKSLNFSALVKRYAAWPPYGALEVYSTVAHVRLYIASLEKSSLFPINFCHCNFFLPRFLNLNYFSALIKP